MRLNMDVSAVKLLEKLKRSQKHIAYAVANALNATGLDVQRAIQKRVVSGEAKFTVRQKQFIQRQAAKINKSSFSSVKRGQPYIEIEVGHVKEGGRELLLADYERGKTRTPFVGKSIAFPTVGGPARRNLASKVPKAWTFEQLQFRQARSRTDVEKGRIGKGSRKRGGSKRKQIWVSARQDAYLIPGVGVFQRVGRRSKLVYYFVPRLTIDQRLQFVWTARRTAAKTFRKNLRTAIKAELEKAASFAGTTK